MLKLTVLCVCVATIYGYPYFLTYIPNGNMVSNPCPGYEGNYWTLVGHRFPIRRQFFKEQSDIRKKLVAQGLNAMDMSVSLLNLFGEAFKNASFIWQKICQEDSDGDGLTNGQELGDPNCEYPAATARLGSPIGHPGICDNNQAEMPNCLAPKSDICPKAPVRHSLAVV